MRGFCLPSQAFSPPLAYLHTKFLNIADEREIGGCPNPWLFVFRLFSLPISLITH